MGGGFRICQDFTVYGGSLGEMNGLKIASIRHGLKTGKQMIAGVLESKRAFSLGLILRNVRASG